MDRPSVLTVLPILVSNSHGAAALKVWFHLRELGREKLRRCVEKNIELAAWLASQIQTTSTLELFAPVVSNIVVFRCVPPSVPAQQLNSFNQDPE